MTQSWPDFLFQKTTSLSQDSLTEFNQPFGGRSKMIETILVPVRTIGVLRISGPDAGEFLQAQLTLNLEELCENINEIAGYCNPKGRLLAIFRILREGNDYLLLSDLKTLPDIAKRLEIYILRMKVTISIDSALFPIGLIGPAAQEIANIIRDNSLGSDQPCHFVQMQSINLPWKNHPGLMFLLGESHLRTTWPTIADAVRLGVPEQWDLFEIRSGVPRITKATQTAFIPQTLNLDLIDAVSFNKGCYPGQEIVARVKYLGRLKQRMCRASFAVGSLPKPGDPIFTDPSHSSRAGFVVNSAQFPNRQGGELLITAPIGTSVRSTFYSDRNTESLRIHEIPHETAT